MHKKSTIEQRLTHTHTTLSSSVVSAVYNYERECWYTHTQTHTNTHEPTYAQIHTCVSKNTHAHTQQNGLHTRTHTYTLAHAHTHTYTHRHAHTYTRRLPSASPRSRNNNSRFNRGSVPVKRRGQQIIGTAGDKMSGMSR